MLDNQELRAAYIEELIRYAKTDDRITLVEADLSKALSSPKFKAEYPDRLIDVGICEANMIGVAAGLAVEGKLPFTHTFTPFATRRVCDQVAISILYAGLKAVMVGSDPGISAELNGGTHMSFEDIGVMRSLPGIAIVEPVDVAQLKAALPQIIDCKEAVYLRLFRKQARKIYDEGCAFTLGKANTLRDGSDVTIIASGIMVGESLDAADALAAEGIQARVLDMHTIKPLDREAVIRAAKETGAIVTCDNHNVVGGLGTAVCEVTSEECPVPVVRIGVTDHFGEVGKMAFLKEKYHMTAMDIAAAARTAIDKKGGK